SQSFPAMFTSGNTSPCHHSLHLFVKTDESQQAGIVQKLSDRALSPWLQFRLFSCMKNIIFEDKLIALGRSLQT
ncbi:hypothetical protein F1542_16770, partial [Komagataeibacter sp. FXV3]|nr:hypothetical protein [Komagataeibacter sp. FXV3]